MRTTIDLDRSLLDEVVKHTGEKSLSKAVNHALEDYVRREKIERLIELAGTIEVDDNWREMEELELAEAAAQSAPFEGKSKRLLRSKPTK